MTNPDHAVQDDEHILRHIPRGGRLNGRSFQPRFHKGEMDLSVSRFPPTSPAALIARVSQQPATSRVAAARAGDIRRLGLDVVPDPLPDDPGHALIVAGTASLIDQVTRDDVAELFQFLPQGA